MKKIFEKMVMMLVEALFKEDFSETKDKEFKDQYTLSSVYPSKKIMKEIKRTIR